MKEFWEKNKHQQKQEKWPAGCVIYNVLFVFCSCFRDFCICQLKILIVPWIFYHKGIPTQSKSGIPCVQAPVNDVSLLHLTTITNHTVIGKQ